MWDPTSPDQTKASAKAKLGKRFEELNTLLGKQQFIAGDAFTVADAYAFTVLNWAPMVKFDLGRWPAITEYHKRVAARPKVQETLKAEGLVK